MWKGNARGRSQMVLTEFHYRPKEQTYTAVYLVSHSSRSQKTILEQKVTMERDRMGEFSPTIGMEGFPKNMSEREAMLKLAEWLQRLGTAIEDNWCEP